MRERPARAGLRTLRGRLTVWLSVASLASLLVFAAVTTITMTAVEVAENPSDPLWEETWEALQAVLAAMVVAAPLALVFSTACAFLLTRRAMRPLEALIQSATGMSASNLSGRLPLPDDAHELRELVVTLNGLFDRIEEGYASISRFAAEASHELRTPLAVIANEIEVDLRRPRTAAEWQSAAARVLDEVHRLSALVDALLRLARAERTSRADDAPIDLRGALEQALGSCAPLAAARGISLVVTHAPSHGAPYVAGDREVLASAFANVIVNAIQHSRQGGTVWLTLQSLATGAAVLHVDDAGPGIPEHERQRVFRPFERGAASPGPGDPPSAGLGLGLAIAQRIVGCYGGSIQALRAPTGGARLTVELPLAPPGPPGETGLS